MPAAEIEIEILADGTVKWKTGKIPDAHHNDADELQKELEAALGGPVERKAIAGKPRHVHTHTDGTVHTHD